MREPHARSWAEGNKAGPLPENPRNLEIPALSVTSGGRPVAVAVLLFVAACGGGGGTVPEASPFADPGFTDAGAWRMHYALTLTQDLPAGIAGSYGIVQRRNLALLTVTIAPRDASATAQPAAPAVEATTIALTGERDALLLARHDEAGGPTWLGSVEIRHRVPVTIEIRARATPASPEMRARLTREFRLD
jgi:hypothetical protein